MLKLKKFLILSLGMTALFGSAAFANEEQSARAGEALMKGLLESSVPVEAPRTATPNRPLIIYRYSTGSSLGLAAEVTEVARYKQYLFVYNKYGHGPQVIAYLSNSGAARDMTRILAGESIDATSCLRHDALLSVVPSAEDMFCQRKTYSLKLSCDEATSVPFMSNLHREWYQLTDIEASAPSVTEEHCIRDHGGKY